MRTGAGVLIAKAQAFLRLGDDQQLNCTSRYVNLKEKATWNVEKAKCEPQPSSRPPSGRTASQRVAVGRSTSRAAGRLQDLLSPCADFRWRRCTRTTPPALGHPLPVVGEGSTDRRRVRGQASPTSEPEDARPLTRRNFPLPQGGESALAAPRLDSESGCGYTALRKRAIASWPRARATAPRLAAPHDRPLRSFPYPGP
jgi:hypothetical protein